MKPRTTTAIRRIELHPVIEQIDAQEHAGDPYAELEGHGCMNSDGHLFKSCCGETKCVFCGEIVWS
jgi:hypothetical protein